MPSIRAATELDHGSICTVHLRAFPESEAPIVAALASDLLSEETRPETFALLAQIDGEVVGHVAFSPVTIDANPQFQGYILAPLGVLPEHQKRRIGSKLVETGIARLSKGRVNTLFVYGDPTYYGRFGFTAEAAADYLPPYELQYPFGWLAIALDDEGAARQSGKIACVASLRDPALW